MHSPYPGFTVPSPARRTLPSPTSLLPGSTHDFNPHQSRIVAIRRPGDQGTDRTTRAAPSQARTARPPLHPLASPAPGATFNAGNSASLARSRLMSVIVYLIVLAATGLLVGALARLALPGPDPMTIPETMLVGIGGAFAAGLIARLLFGSPAPGILLSVLAATGIVHVIRRRRGGEPVRPYGSQR
jgi:uncharacterized membrane protein YeaQ/YmgE (transglycosylase-associated protein family)